MSTQMMKAVQQHAFGGPEVLSYDDAPLPAVSYTHLTLPTT